MPRALPHVILLHGFKGFMDWGFFPEMARRIAARGIAVVRCNVSGSGIGEDLENFTELESFARNTLGRELEDIGLLRDWIRDGVESVLDPDRAVLVGHSRGGGLALLHASERDGCRGIVTWAAVADFDRFDDASKRIWREQGFLPVWNARTGQEMRLGVEALADLELHRDRYDVLAACRKLRRPVLLVHGSRDESVPAQESECILRSLEPSVGSLLLVEGAGHTFGIRHPMTASSDAFETVAAATLERILMLLD